MGVEWGGSPRHGQRIDHRRVVVATIASAVLIAWMVVTYRPGVDAPATSQDIMQVHKGGK